MPNNIIQHESLGAAADLSAKQNYLVKLGTAANTVALCSAATDAAIGVLRNKPKSSEAAAVACGNGSRIEVISDGSGTAISIGDYVGPNSSGKAVKKATADYSACGIAMQASSTDGAVIEIYWLGPAFFRSAGG